MIVYLHKLIAKAKNIAFKLTVKIRLKDKILLIFTVFLLLPLILFTIVSYVKTKQLIESQTIRSMSQSYDESISILERYFTSMRTAMENILTDKETYQTAEQSMEPDTVLNQYSRYQILARQFNYIQTVSDVDNILLYLDSDHLHIQNELHLLPFSQAVDSDWYSNFQTDTNSRFWVTPNIITEADGSLSNFFSYMGILYNTSNLKQPLGMLRIDISEEKIIDALNGVHFTDQTRVFLTDGIDSIYSLTQTDDPFLISNLKTKVNDINNHQWNNAQYEQEKIMVRSEKLSGTNWYLVVLVPIRDVFHAQHILYQYLAIVLIVIGAFSFIFAYAVSYSSLKRIYILNAEIQKAESGNLDIDLEPIGNDEIGELMLSYKKMNSRMKEIINEKYQMGQEVKSAELRALQAQINPHFLYNTLDVINCLAIDHDIPEIVDMISALARFYKLSLSLGRDTISLYDEFLHVEAYMEIQNMRFEKQIQYIRNIEPWMELYLVPKTILQPLVENAILHGILRREDHSGIIHIHAQIENDIITITIEDNGVGMTPEVMSSILNMDSHGKTGYGVRNTHERIVLHYGHSFGLHYDSVVGCGTVVTVSLPAIPIT